MPAQDIVAAGAVVFRPGREVLLVHRPKYDDWSFPKGKLDHGEHPAAAAVREVEEETGLTVRLGPRLPSLHYPVARGMKTVHYWTGRAVGSTDVSRYHANDEVDQVAWVPHDKALRLLSYPHDAEMLERAYEQRKKTRVVVVLRHAESRARASWRGEDQLRPLLAVGKRRAAALVPLLAAYGVQRIVTSPSTRCVQTVQPYAQLARIRPEQRPPFSEEGASPAAVAAGIEGILRALKERGPTVVCSHRPVLPLVFEALGIEAVELEKGEMVVVHLRHGSVVATEQQDVG